MSIVFREEAAFEGLSKGMMQISSGMQATLLRFGHKPYGEIFSRVNLPAPEKDVLALVNEMTQARGVQKLERHLKALESPFFTHFTHPLEGRRPFHTPVTDLFLNMEGVPDRARLLGSLEHMVRLPANPTAMKNAVSSLLDIYFYALRPGGHAFRQTPRGIGWTLRQTQLQVKLYGIFGKILLGKGYPAQAPRFLRDKLSQHWRAFQMAQTISGKREPHDVNSQIKKQMTPLLNMQVDAAASREPLSSVRVRTLMKALLSTDPNVLRNMSASGELAEILPEWQRLTGPDNVQHQFHDFPLDEHTLKTVEFTRNSPYYQVLSDKEKQLVMLAALFHDIHKHTGPAHMREAMIPDRPHPLRSAMGVREILPTFGFNQRDTERVAILVEFHQLFGSMMIMHPDEKVPNEETLEYAALRLRSNSMLNMLKALSEGDIRSVKKGEALFSDDVKVKLKQFSTMVEERIERYQDHGVHLPQTRFDDLFASAQPPVASKSLDDLLKRMAAPDAVSGYSQEGGIRAVRVSSKVPHAWMTMPLEQWTEQNGNGETLTSETLQKLYYQPVSWLPAVSKQVGKSYGIVTDVFPENIAVADLMPIENSVESLRQDEKAFGQIVTGNITNEKLKPLRERRERHADYMGGLANFYGMGHWSELYRMLQRYDYLEQWPGYMQTTGQLMAGLQTRHFPFPTEALAIQPILKGIYYVQQRPGDTIKLPAAVKKFMLAQKLPLVIITASEPVI